MAVYKTDLNGLIDFFLMIKYEIKAGIKHAKTQNLMINNKAIPIEARIKGFIINFFFFEIEEIPKRIKPNDKNVIGSFRIPEVQIIIDGKRIIDQKSNL